MELLGAIVHLQIQVTSLKVGVAPQKRYSPAGLVPVPRLELSADGVVGIGEDDARLGDVHNLTHPVSKNRAGTNGISIGFTTHYDAMRTRFGNHLVDTIAGENILVRGPEHGRIVTEDELRRDVVIETAGGPIHLLEVFVAAPCVEFSRWALRFPDDQRPDRTVTEALQFLNDGMRGYYASYRGEPVVITVGDRVYLT